MRNKNLLRGVVVCIVVTEITGNLIAKSKFH